MVSSVGVACTRTLRPFISAMFLISRLEYMLRRPSVDSAMTRAPCTVSAIIALTALDTSGSAIALTRCASERNRKCIDITPACGDSVAAFADDEMQNSTSPDFTSCRTCGSCPSCDRGCGHDRAENGSQVYHCLPLWMFSFIIPSGLFECQSNKGRKMQVRDGE